MVIILPFEKQQFAPNCFYREIGLYIFGKFIFYKAWMCDEMNSRIKKTL
jgi:hypothetical protein